MKYFRSLLRFFMSLELAIGALLVVMIVILISMEIIMRYFVGNPIVWVQEFVLYLFIVITALGASVAIKTNSHIEIDTIVRLLPQKALNIVNVVVSLIILGSLLFLANKLPAAIKIQNMSKTSSLPINFPRGYYYSMPILVSVWGMIISKLYYFYYEIRELIGLENSEDYNLELPQLISEPDLPIEDV